MRALLLLLALPLSAAGAVHTSLSSVACDGPPQGRPRVEAAPILANDEMELAAGSLKPALSTIDRLHNLSLAQFQEARPADSAATSALVAGVLRQAYPSAQLATRVRQQAQAHYRAANCKAAHELYTIATALATHSVTDRHALTIDLLSEQAYLFAAEKRPQLAQPLLTRIAAALEAAPALLEADRTLNLSVADVAYRAGQFAMAEKFARAALAQADTGKPNRASLAPLHELAAALYGLGQITQAEEIRARGDSWNAHLDVADGKVIEVNVPDTRVPKLLRSGDVGAAMALADKLMQEADARRAAAVTALDELEKAQTTPPTPATSEAIRQQRATYLDATWTLSKRLADVAELHHATGDLARAEPLYRRALALLSEERAHGAGFAARMYQGLGILLRQKGALDDAETQQKSAYNIYQRSMSGEHPFLIKASAELGAIAAAQGKFDAALQQYTTLATAVRAQRQPDRAVFSEVLLSLANVQLKLENRTAAEATFSEVRALWRDGGTARDAMYVASLGGLGAIYSKEGRVAESQAIRAELKALKQ